MELLLSWNRESPPQAGWFWFDETHPNQDPNLTYGTLLVEPATVIRLVSEHVLDRLPEAQIHSVLSYWISLLAHGGEIVLNVTDFETVARSYLAQEIDIHFVSSRLAGRGSLHSLEGLVAVCIGSGLQIVTARTEGYAAVIVARRP